MFNVCVHLTQSLLYTCILLSVYVPSSLFDVLDRVARLAGGARLGGLRGLIVADEGHTRIGGDARLL